jgi:iron complex outermembrane recepter protein
MHSLPIRLALKIPLAFFTACALGMATFVQAADDHSDSLADLSLEELTNLKVSSVNKKTQRASDVAAAVFVITQDDIRRSGASSIPQALRLVPGLQVAQIDGNKWAISARGFNSRFANRLLVLRDGRTLYTLTFGGVFWDAQETMIEDIERIEVIRGPGGAMWGANAFNGVINIITKSTAQTDGALTTAQIGTNQNLGASARVGNTDSNVKWRAFGKGFERQGNINWLEQDGNDDWREARVGGRVDITLANTDTLQFSSEAYQGRSGMEIWNYATLPALTTITAHDEYEGAFLTGEWSTATTRGGHLGVHALIDYTNRDSVIFDERRTTYDLELQHNLKPTKHNDIVWGMGLRHTNDSTHRTVIAVIPASDALTIYSGFIQDEIALLDQALHVTLGGKVEHSDYIGTQLMPNLRLRYNASEQTVLWSALSRGIRSASRLERNVRVSDAIPSAPPFSALNPTPIPLGIEIWGDPEFAPEKLTAFEIGVRHQFSDSLAIDLATYYNDYAGMRGMRRLAPRCSPSMTPIESNPACMFTATKIIVPVQYTSLLSGNIVGAELTATWNPVRYWRLVASYAYLNQQFQENPIDFGVLQLDFSAYSAGLNATNQWSLRSSLSLGTHWDWDLFLRHVDALPAGEVAAYTELNTRIAWRPRIDFEIALVGENLLQNEHREFVSDFVDLAPVSIKRAAFLNARWSF